MCGKIGIVACAETVLARLPDVLAPIQRAQDFQIIAAVRLRGLFPIGRLRRDHLQAVLKHAITVEQIVGHAQSAGLEGMLRPHIIPQQRIGIEERRSAHNVPR